MEARRLRALVWIVGALLLVVYGFCFFRPLWDVDVFWHIRAGEWIVQHLALPERDLFSAVDPTRPWHTFEWGYEVLCWLADRIGGLTAVRGLDALVLVAAFGSLAAILWRRTRSPAALLLGTVPLLVGFADRIRVRPDSFNLLFAILLLPRVLKRRWTTGDFAVMLVVSGLWANVHGGGVLLLFAMIAGRGVGIFFEDLAAAAQTPAERAAAPVLIPGREIAREAVLSVSLVAFAFAMPGFAAGVYQAFFMLGPSERFIPEWMNTFQVLFTGKAGTLHEVLAALGPVLWLLVLLGRACADAARGGWRMRSLPWRPVMIAVPLGILGLEHIRFAWLGGLIATLTALHLPWTPPARGLLRPRAVRAVAGLALLALMALNLDYHVNHLHGGAARMVRTVTRDLEPGAFPEQAADFLRDTGICGGVMNFPSWGGYLIYRLWPCCRVYTDGRGNFSPIETHVLTTMESPLSRRRAFDASWNRAPYDLIVHPDPFPLDDYYRFFWILVYRDEVARVYLRNMPENDAAFDRVRGWYRARGVELSESVLFERDARAFEHTIRRYHGERMARTPGVQRRIQELSARAATGDARNAVAALQALGQLLFDLGLHDEARAVLVTLSERDPTNPRALLLYLRTWLADGDLARTWPLCRRLLDSMSETPALQALLTEREKSIAGVTCAWVHDHEVRPGSPEALEEAARERGQEDRIRDP